jgi:hypothetical protein
MKEAVDEIFACIEIVKGIGSRDAYFVYLTDTICTCAARFYNFYLLVVEKSNVKSFSLLL